MKNDLSNTEIAPVVTLPESIRIPLHSLQADLGYLIGRVIADGSCGPMVIKSMRERLDQIEPAILSLPAHPGAGEREASTILDALKERIQAYQQNGSRRFYGSTVAADLEARIKTWDAGEHEGCGIDTYRAVEHSNVLPKVLPCDVHLPPNTFLRKGCQFDTFMTALRAREKFPDDAKVFQPRQPSQSSSEADRCIACDVVLNDGDLVHHDASGGLIHAACCGPERESYTGADGGPLKDGEPIPQPWNYSKSSSEMPR